MTKMELPSTEPTSVGSFYGAFDGIIRDASMKMKDKRKDGASCNPFYEVEATVYYDDGRGNERKKKIFGRLPMDWKKEGAQFGSLYLAKGTEWENLVSNFEKETEGKIVTILGSVPHWKTGETKSYIDDKGDARISYEPIGFFPVGTPHEKAWTKEMEEEEKEISRNFSGDSGSPASYSVASVPDLEF